MGITGEVNTRTVSEPLSHILLNRSCGDCCFCNMDVTGEVMESSFKGKLEGIQRKVERERNTNRIRIYKQFLTHLLDFFI